ncbi:glycoside hydrolase [Wallemia mellicola]|nr:glycoside hydrolase [Wallemia mellicola]
MESQLALTGKDYTLIVSDTNAAMSIIRMKDDEDKMKQLGEHLVMAYNGEAGDTIQFAEYVERNLRLHSLRHDIELQPKASASWIRRQLADSLRSRKPYAVNLLLGGWDVPKGTPELYWIDYLGTLAHVPYACHGYADAKNGTFVDQHHRNCYPRGVNLSGGSKLPSNQSATNHEDFYNWKAVSFVNKPFPIENAEYHLNKLKNAGMTFIRLIVTWEALEHSGCGIYDYEYMDYLATLCSLMEKHGFKIVIDAHQDIWSRMTGGSGAPGWTVELAGYDVRALDDTAAAYLYPICSQKGPNWSAQPGDGLEHGVWPSGYQKNSAATLSTLFWGGSTFAPSFVIDGKNIQDILQEAYLNAFAELSKRLESPAIVAFELMNEPHRGYIELDNFECWNYNTDLHIAHMPTPVQGMALAMGHAVTVDYYTRTFPFPTRKSGVRKISPVRKAYKNDAVCPWLREGVWAYSTDKSKPVVLRQDYFKKHPLTGKTVEWYHDFYMPFAKKFYEKCANGRWCVVEPIPNEFFPNIPAEEQPKKLIASPHWYDLNALFKKEGTWWSVNVQGLARGMMIWNALYIGYGGLKKNYAKQIGRLVHEAKKNLGDVPVFFGETGIPMDLNDGEGQKKGMWKYHEWSLDALICALEKHATSFTLWNYNPDNINDGGDVWNGENFSLFSKDAIKGDDSVTDGLRIPEVWIRPYASKVSGEPLEMAYNRGGKKYTLRMRPREGVSEIFIPAAFFDAVEVVIDGGSYEYVKSDQTVYWKTESSNDVVEMSIKNPKHKVPETFFSMYGPLIASLLFMLAAVVARNHIQPVLLALKEQQQ